MTVQLLIEPCDMQNVRAERIGAGQDDFATSPQALLIIIQQHFQTVGIDQEHIAEIKYDTDSMPLDTALYFSCTLLAICSAESGWSSDNFDSTES
jgi:hypothetical protein